MKESKERRKLKEGHHDETEVYLKNFNRKYSEKLVEKKIEEDTSLLAILKKNKNLNNRPLRDLFPSLHTDLNLKSLEQEKATLDRLSLGLSMLNLHSNVHKSIEKIFPFSKTTKKYWGVLIDESGRNKVFLKKEITFV